MSQIGKSVFLVIYDREADQFSAMSLEQWILADLNLYQRLDISLKQNFLILAAYDAEDEATSHIARLQAPANS